MESSEDVWESVFALAENVHHPSDTLAEPVNGGASCKGQKKRRKSSKNNSNKKKGTTRHETPARAGDDAVFQSYLLQRSSSTIEWPSWMSLQEGLNPRRCSHWLDDNPTTTDPSDAAYSNKCSSCQQSALRHVSRAAAGRSLTPVQELFLALRNLRCVAVLLALHVARHREEEPYDVPLATVNQLYEDWKRGVRRLQRSFASVPENLHRACRQVNPQILRAEPTKAVLEPVVELLMSLDNAYFRLYYSVLSQDLPFIDGEAAIPHPVCFFGLVAVDMNCYEQLAKKLPIRLPVSVHPQGTETTHRLLLDRFCVTKTCDSAGRFEHAKHPENETALSLLHRLRFVETVALFHAWSTKDSTKRQVVASCRASMDRHETPAPETLMRWRDSCRDFLCHLYCYATLPRATLEKLRLVLVQQKINTVIELGAGTGYLAHLLHELLSGDGIAVEAVDLRPTSSSTSASSSARNEYHASTPPFFDVRGGSESAIDDRILDCTQTAMVLCYPPPESNFAYDAARRFTARNGQLILFIGEFKGLTGNSRFERLLQSDFDCVERLSCLCWGTDASTVTVWAARPSSSRRQDSPSSLLLPCSCCGNAESVKRCRLLRCLSYCSRRCFDQHALIREAALRLVMIDMEGTRGLDFDAKHHFFGLG